jgi:hypothetical protein
MGRSGYGACCIAKGLQALVDPAAGLTVFTDDENGWLFHDLYLLCGFVMDVEYAGYELYY